MRRIFIDTEFTDLPWTGRSTLFWVGLCDDTGYVYSAVNADVDLTRCSSFVRDRVLPLIPAGEPRLTTAALAAAVRQVCAGVAEFWAWQPTVDQIAEFGFDRTQAAVLYTRYAGWDLQLLRALTGQNTPPWRHCHELHRLADQAGIVLAANPIAQLPGFDAAWGRQVFLDATLRRKEQR